MEINNPQDLQSVLDLGLPLIKKWEGLKLKPYLCSAGVPTIGYGSTFYLDGTKVTLKDNPITEARADELLIKSIISTYLPAVLVLCPTLENVNQVAAILSFTYNLGTGALSGSTLRKRILEKKWEEVPTQLKRWNIAGGSISRGLTLRREDEIRCFMQNSDLK